MWVTKQLSVATDIHNMENNIIYETFGWLSFFNIIIFCTTEEKQSYRLGEKQLQAE